MNFINPVNRARIPLVFEGSKLRSVRDSDSVSRWWPKVNQANRQDGANSEWGRRIQQQVAQLSRRVLTPPVTTAIPPYLFPFKIYQPTLDDLGTTQVFPNFGAVQFNDDGSTTGLGLDGTQPTGGNNINPFTDLWRLWQVYGCGNSNNQQYAYVQTRPYFYSFVSDEFGPQIYYDYSSIETPFLPSVPVTLSNGVQTQYPAYFAIQNEPSSYDGLVHYAVWVEITPDNGGNFMLTGLKGKIWKPEINSYPFPPTSGSSQFVIPVGMITLVPPGASIGGANPAQFPKINQLLFDNLTNRFNAGMGDNPVAQGTDAGTLNYRGDWDNDATIKSQFFYPSDVVLKRATVGSFTSFNWYRNTAYGFTTDPSIDTNWKQIAGAQ